MQAHFIPLPPPASGTFPVGGGKLPNVDSSGCGAPQNAVHHVDEKPGEDIQIHPANEVMVSYL